jgi:2-phosphosulfolactate phosphatase
LVLRLTHNSPETTGIKAGFERACFEAVSDFEIVHRISYHSASDPSPIRLPRDCVAPRHTSYHRRMPPTVHVHMLPALIGADALTGGVAVMIDVLRASTTIVHALAAGAESVVPCESVEEARQSAKRFESGTVLLGGERGGVRIEGFDLGNSPLEYTPERVAGRTIVFTTTNGTRALRACEPADRVLIGAFVNRAALTRVLREDRRDVHLVCAGTEGHLTAEDILLAGAVTSDLTGDQRPGRSPEIDVPTQMAIDYYLARSATRDRLLETMRSSRGGTDLMRLGYETDIDQAAEEDLFDVVPEWSRETGAITL